MRHLLTHTAGTTDYPPDFDFRRDYIEEDGVFSYSSRDFLAKMHLPVENYKPVYV